MQPMRLDLTLWPRRLAYTLLVLAGLGLWPLNQAAAQLPQARLHSIFPPGGQAGTTVEVRLTSGVDLDEANRLLFDHAGITAVQKTQEAAGAQVPVDGTFQVSIAPDVPPGLYEVRAAGYYGLSNPRTFVVGSLAEIQETEPNNAPEQATAVALNTIVNAATGSATDVDYYKFTATTGQRILVSCRAARIDSRLNATIELFDLAGRRLARSRNDLRNDPLVDFTPEADGEYVLRVFDFTYGGGADYFYRLQVGTGPHIDYIMPPAGLLGSTGRFTLFGRNLPGAQPASVAIDGHPLERLDVDLTLPQAADALQTLEYPAPVEAGQDGFSYSLSTPSGDSNGVFVYYAAGPVAIEQEPNDAPAQAQSMAAPGEFAGQFQALGDIDVVSFEAKTGDVYVIEVFGERNNFAPTDPYMLVEQVAVNDKGEETLTRLTAQDDTPATLSPLAFNTLTDDPAFRFVAPADGKYRITLRDRYYESRGDPRLIYRLAIRKEQPDFRLVVQPIAPQAPNTPAAGTWSTGLRKGDNLDVQVLAFRRDGFNEPIEVSAEGLPEGVECKGVVIGAGETAAALIFTAAETAADWAGTIRVVGKAKLEDPEKIKAVDAAQAVFKSKTDALAPLADASGKAAEAVKGAEDQLAAAVSAARKSPDDAALQQAVIAAIKAAATVDTALQQAATAQQAGEQQAAEANAALVAAQQAREAAIQQVTRAARPATVVWNGDATTPPISRIGRTFELSVHSEQSPIQVTTDVFHVAVNQSRQILVPVALAKRNGFDENVALTFMGLSKNSKIQAENKPINKGSAAEVLRLFVPNDTPPGIYATYLSAQGQVSYRRNLPRLARIQAEQAEIAKSAEAVAAAAKTATEQLDAATQQATASEDALKQATETLAAAEKKSLAAAELATVTGEKHTKATKVAGSTTTAAKLAADAAASAAQAAADAADSTVAEALTATAKTLADVASSAAEAQKQASAASAVAEQAHNEAAQAAKTAAAELETAKQAMAAADAALKTAQEAKTVAEVTAKQTDEQTKAAAAAKEAADKKLQDAENAAKPANINVFPPSTPLIIEVKPAPATLAANVPDDGNLKQSAKVDVSVTVNRTSGFAGPVTLTLPLPPGVSGLSAAPVTVPPDQKEGVLSIQAAADATEGKLPNMVIRASMDFQGEAAVDVPVTITVVK